MQPKGGPRLLITDREGALLLERARVHVENGRILYHAADDDRQREFNIPHANLAVLFLGQGTSITQEAMRMLGDEGVHVAFTGTGGTPLHMGALTTYVATRHFRELLPIYLDPALSLAAARVVMGHRADRVSGIGGKLAMKFLRVRQTDELSRLGRRLKDDVAAAADNAALLGYEGQYSKQCYACFARMAGFGKDTTFIREAGAGAGEPGGAIDPIRLVNRLIDHGNYLCYGIAGGALWALGIPPHLSVFHGKTRAGGLVFDLADSFKDALVLPLAFAEARSRDRSEAEGRFRDRMIDAFNDHAILAAAILTVNEMLAVGQSDTPQAGRDA